MKSTVKLVLVGSLLTILGVAAVSRNVFANSARAIAIMPEEQIRNQVGQNSLRDLETKDDAKESRGEQQESAKLQSLAKITPQQAQQNAEAALGGKANRVKLENEDGNLVYSVEIGTKEAKVDAGNGRVLYVEAKNNEDSKNEASHPRSSIQVSEAPGGDGDGETNDDG